MGESLTELREQAREAAHDKFDSMLDSLDNALLGADAASDVWEQGVLAFIQSEEAKQAMAAGMHQSECVDPGYGGCEVGEHMQDAAAAQAALVALLKGESDG